MPPNLPVPFTAILPDPVILPTTWKVSLGADVPIPTLPLPAK